MNNLANSVRLTGWVGADPVIKHFENKSKLARVTLATHYYYQNAEKERVKDTDWHQLVFNGQHVDLVGKMLNKGSQIAIEGRLRYRRYTDKEGAKRSIAEIMVSELLLLDKAQEN